LVTIDDSPVDVDTRKAIAMLAYLAVERSADREVLSLLFWADSPADRARAALRRTLSALRGAVGDNIEADRQQVTLRQGFTCDLDEFDALVEETAHHDHDPGDVCSACVLPLRQATALYRGDFLGSFTVRDAPEFEDWVRSVAESSRLKAGNALRRLAMAQASIGDYPAAIDAAGRWVGLDELHEPAHRLAMLLHAWRGDRPGAIQAYRDCVAILDRELGVAPLGETTELYEAILDDDLPPAPGLPRPIKTHRAPQSATNREMLDRREAVEAVERALDTIDTGARLMVVTGDSWMGKTRLVEHLGVAASNRGNLTVSGTGFRAESGLPYGVAVQLLDGLTGALGPESRSVPGWVRDELNRLDPRLAPGSDVPETGQIGQLRLSEAFLALVETAAESRPVVLVVDDAQWADPASASLLAYLARRAGDTNLLIVLSTRETDALHPALREVATDADETVELRPLRAEDLRPELPDTDLAAILSATGGIPLLVKEAITSGGVDPDSSTVVKYMESRRRRVSDLGRQVLAAAAVLDGMCDAGLLKDTSGRTEEEIVDAVEELISRGLLREQDDGRLAFTLDVLETITYDSTSLTRRLLLHRRAADALAARPRARSDARVATATAEHLRAAGSPDAATWFRLAGDLSREVFAGEEAAVSYETAIALGHPDVGELRLTLGELAMARGHYETATSELRTAAAHADGELLALVEHRIGDLNRILGRFELAEESFARAEGQHPRPSELYADWALLKQRTGDGEMAVQMASRAESSARESDDDRALARALNILGVVTPDTVQAGGFIDAALDLIDSDDPSRIAALNNKAHLLGGSGDIDTAIELVDAAIAISAKAGFRHHQAALLNHLADLNHQAGREDEAEAALTQAVTLFADIVAGDWEPEVWLLRQW
jgi:DNA-binding SARP family transcriptional activator/tetratricopeptide (TPR) repeat protein